MTTETLDQAMRRLDADPVATEWARQRVDEALCDLETVAWRDAPRGWLAAVEGLRRSLLGDLDSRASLGVFDPRVPPIVAAARRAVPWARQRT